MGPVLISIISRNIKEENGNFKKESMNLGDYGFLFSADSGEGVHELDGNIRKGVHKLDGKVLAVVHKLPFSDVIRKCGDHFHLEVREGVYHLYPDIGKGIHHPHLSGESDIFEISICINGTCRKGRSPGKKEEEQSG
jgi:hypothetical protein